MKNKDLLIVKKQDVTAVGKSNKSWHQAYDACFTDMRNQLLKDDSKIFVSISLLHILDIRQSKTDDESPLKKLVSRKRKEYQVELDLVVEVKYINIEEEL